MPKHSKNFLYNTLGTVKCKKSVCSLKIAVINIHLPLVHVFFLTFGTLYVDAAKGRKLLTGDGLVDIEELVDTWRDCVRQVREYEAIY